MTLRIAVLGCLLAAVGWADEPITMHNDPMTFYNGSVQGIFQTRTFIPQVSVPALLTAGPKTGFPPGFFPGEKDTTLLSHGHPNGGVGQIVLVLRPSGTKGILEKVNEIHFQDGDGLHISLNTGEIVIRKGSIPGAALGIPAHAHTPGEFDPCLQALILPMRAAAGAPNIAHGPQMIATRVTWGTTVKTVALGSQIVLSATATPANPSISASVPAAQATLSDNGANTITGPVESGGRIRFLVTPALAGDHCFAVAYPATREFAGSKSAETCVRVLPAGCPVMSGAELQAQKVMAANVANTVWAIRSNKPWDAAAVSGKVVTVKYPGQTPTPLMSSIWLETNSSARTPIDPHCGVIHFCHMKDVVDQSGTWTLQPDCAPVKFTCHPSEDYTWTPPNTGVSNQNTQSNK